MIAMHDQRREFGRRGFTIVELLIVITIMGILIAMMMPAIQASREAARRLQCMNNLKQVGLAAIGHLNAHGFLPSGGWGFRWVGDPSRGFGPRQPGGWVYSILPFTEEKALWSFGAGIDSGKDPDAKRSALAGQVSKAIAVLYCPTRRAVGIYPYTALRPPANVTFTGPKPSVLKADYAINVGDEATNQFPGPPSSADADGGSYDWPPTGRFTGVSYQRSQVSVALILDGLSHTYLIGEKYLSPIHYSDGADLGDNDAATQGFDNDTCRRAAPNDAPMQDAIESHSTVIFGSAHPLGFHFVFCDGSVHLIDFTIDSEVHSRLANRADGQSLNSRAIH